MVLEHTRVKECGEEAKNVRVRNIYIYVLRAGSSRTACGAQKTHVLVRDSPAPVRCAAGAARGGATCGA